MTIRKKNALILIDCQVDFVSPSGSLFVPGSEQDCKNITNFILNNHEEIDWLGASLDSHRLNSIFHPSFWIDKNGKNPDPFTLILKQDVLDGKFSPRFYPQESIKYLESLEAQGDKHVIWPNHCLISSKGANLDENILEAIKTWELKGKYCNFITKGTHVLTENYGIFCAQVPIPGSPETDLNLRLLKTLEEYQNLYIAGEARNFCVVNSLKQLLKHAPSLTSRLVLLEDCMSNVPGFDGLGDDVFDQARKAGVRFSTSTAENLKNTKHSLV